MAVNGSRVTVATTATAISGADSDGVYGSSVLVKNAGAASVFLGGSGVTTEAGFELAAGEAVSLDLNVSDSVYGIVASGTVVCHVLASGA